MAEPELDDLNGREVSEIEFTGREWSPADWIVRRTLAWVNKLKQLESEGAQVIMVRNLVEKVRAEEREACAKLSVQVGNGQGHDDCCCEAIARAIRSRI